MRARSGVTTGRLRIMRLPPPITSRTNARVKALRAALSGEARGPGDLLGLEGPNLIREAHARGLSFETAYLREGSEATFYEAARWGETLRTKEWAVLSAGVFDSAVSTRAPQGVAATWVIEEPKPTEGWYTGLVLENIQDPGNLGTLIRSAAAFGMGNVMITPDCVNHWNPKVVRAAAGALFSTRVLRLPLARIGEELQARGVRLFAAVAGFLTGPGDGTAIMAAPHGVLTGRRNNYEAEKPRYNYPPDQDAKEGRATDGYPASLSYDTDFLEPCAILIGNEAAGLSQEARRLADEQVQIPCSVESLNAAVAGSVLMYEVMRQRILRQWARQQGLRA